MWAALGNFLKKKAKDKVKDKVKNNVSNLDESKQFLIKVVAASSGSILPILFFSFLVVIIVALPVLVVSEFSDNLKNSKAAQFFEKANNFVTFKGWCSDTDGSCEEKAEQKYYEKLEKINDRYDGKVDIELITATIFYGYNSSLDVNATDENGQNPKFIDYFCEAHGIGFGGEELCKVVVKNNYDEVYDKYGERYFKIAPNYEALRDSNCKDSVTLIGSKIPVVRLGIIPAQFWTNYTISEACEFYLFNFADLAQVTFEDNSLTLLYQRAYEEADELASKMIKSSKLNYDEYRDYLIKTYIPDHFYSLYGYKKSEDHEKEIGIIADDIMSFASMKMEKETSYFAGFNSAYSSCSQITLKDRNGNITVHDLEEYVAGVATAENGGANDEALKLQTLAARSFAVKNCDRVIVNSIGDIAVDGKIDMAYKEPSDRAVAAAEATKGQILTYNGEVFELSFASYPRSNYRGGFPGYEASGYLCSDVVCNSNNDGREWCTTTLYKQPNMEAFELKMPNTSLSGSFWNGVSLSNQKGHCYGISQVATIYYENELNYTYDQMIKEFLSPGVEIVSIIGSFGSYNGQIASTKGTVYLPYELDRVLNENGSNIDAFNDYIKQAVLQAGPGTRAGVVAAANALIGGLAQYGYQLPYISSRSTDSGYYQGFGARGDWGKHVFFHNDYYNHDYYQAGLDCSSFTSWAVHNGGFKYFPSQSGAQRNHESVSARAYGSYTGQPGDIVWHSGHVGLLLGISDDGMYIVAEEQGDPTGLVVTYYNMKKSSWTAILDMSSYYSNPSNLDLDYYQGG